MLLISILLISQAHLIYCTCEHPDEMYVQLRGLCPDSYIDQVYIPRNRPKSGNVDLLGFKNTIIKYEGSQLGWKMWSDVQNTTAHSKAPLASFVLGKHEWAIKGDNMECSESGEPYTRLLKLTGCREGEFTCSDGQCIRGQTLMYQTRQRLNGCRQGQACEVKCNTSASEVSTLK